MCVTRLTVPAHANQATMEAVVIKLAHHIVVITHVRLLMDHASVLKDITVNIVKGRV